MQKHILVTGATGFIGVPLVQALVMAGYRVTILVRNLPKAQGFFANTVHYLRYEASEELPSLDTPVHGLVHLMGENVMAGIAASDYEEKLHTSRVHSAKALAQRFDQQPLEFVVSASAIGIYEPAQGDYTLDENAPHGKSSLAQLCEAWEASILQIAAKRHVIMRLPMVMGPDGGAFLGLYWGFLTRIGSILGDPKAYTSWVHRLDVIRFVLQACDPSNTWDGVFNLVGQPVQRKILAATLGKKASACMTLPLPEKLLQTVLGKRSAIVLDNLPVVAAKLQSENFTFQFVSWQEAIDDLWKQAGFTHRTYMQRIPRPFDEVFPFFSDPKNLERITPPWLHFKILKAHPTPLQQDTIIDYSLRLHGIPLKWKSKITLWDPPHAFEDQQLVGPYHYWRHTHRFIEVPSLEDDGKPHTVMLDVLQYQLPQSKYFTTLTRAVMWFGAFYVNFDVRRIFQYRYHKIAELFPAERS